MTCELTAWTCQSCFWACWCTFGEKDQVEGWREGPTLTDVYHMVWRLWLRQRTVQSAKTTTTTFNELKCQHYLLTNQWHCMPAMASFKPAEKHGETPTISKLPFLTLKSSFCCPTKLVCWRISTLLCNLWLWPKPVIEIWCPHMMIWHAIQWAEDTNLLSKSNDTLYWLSI